MGEGEGGKDSLHGHQRLRSRVEKAEGKSRPSRREKRLTRNIRAERFCVYVSLVSLQGNSGLHLVLMPILSQPSPASRSMSQFLARSTRYMPSTNHCKVQGLGIPDRLVFTKTLNLCDWRVLNRDECPAADQELSS